MDLGIKDRVALVTGTDSGMGFAVARFLAEAGVKVMMSDREPETLHAAARDLAREGGDTRAVAAQAADLTDASAVEHLLRATKAAFGAPDILVHAAGITGPVGDFLDLTDEDWAKTIDIDFLAAVRVCRAVIPAMKARGWGRIVLFSSEDGLQPYVEDLPYCACKAAILNLAKGLSKAYGGHGLTVNSVLPAFIATPMTDAMMEKRAKADGVTVDEAVARFLRKERPGIATGRRGLPAEVASAVAYLCSAHASFVNGTALRVDGGSVATI
jgi:NAD(P)-dependent dehydrogenase (short-subunit alcohol dehydrogenase family)